MLTVTDAARELLSEMMVELRPTEGKVVRIVASSAGISLVLGEILEDDLVFNHDAKSVLAVAQDVARDGQCLTLDAVTTVRGADLRVTADINPSVAEVRSITVTPRERTSSHGPVPPGGSS